MSSESQPCEYSHLLYSILPYEALASLRNKCPSCGTFVRTTKLAASFRCLVRASIAKGFSAHETAGLTPHSGKHGRHSSSLAALRNLLLLPFVRLQQPPTSLRRGASSIPYFGGRLPRLSPSFDGPKAPEERKQPRIDSPYPRIVEASTMAKLKQLREPQLHVRVHTTPTVDTRGTSVILEFAGDRYLIGNAHEGVSRVFTEQTTALSKFSDIILSGKTDWQSNGGLLGLILTLADSRGAAWVEGKANGDKVPEKATLKLTGGPNLTYLLATARKFIFRQDCRLDVRDLGEQQAHVGANEPTWCDENIQAWALPIEPSEEPRSPKGATVRSHVRKRSFDDFSESIKVNGRDSGNHPNESGHERSHSPRDLTTLRSTVSDMFDSDWRIDALVEKPLSEVDPLSALFVKNSKTKDFEKYQGPRPGSDDPLPNIKVWTRKPWPGANVKSLPRTKPSGTAMSYIIKDYPRRGRVDPVKVRALGLVGRQIGFVSEGGTVTTDSGTVVTTDQILGDAMPSTGLAFVDLPSVDYVPGLVARKEWCDTEVMAGICSVIWHLGPGVTKDKQLQEFIGEFPQLAHIISSPDHCANSLVFNSISAMTVAKHRVDDARYHVPVHNNSVMSLPPSLSSCTLASPGLQVNLRKEPLIDTAGTIQPLNTAKVVQEIETSILEDAESLRKRLNAPTFSGHDKQDLPSPESEIITLGTGASRPSKYRGLSGTLLRVPSVGAYLFDSGENTLGQLKRVYSPEHLPKVLRSLKMIFISHMHADHHLGLVSIIKAWHQAVHGVPKSRPRSPRKHSPIETPGSPGRWGDRQRLVIASEPAMIDWLNEYSMVEDYGQDDLILLSTRSTHRIVNGVSEARTVIVSNDVRVGFDPDRDAFSKNLKRATGLAKFEVAKVPHCMGAHGVSLTFPEGLKVTYSGDCRPSKELVEIGKGSTLLVHEATFGDDKAGHALAKKHSTVSEAIGVGVAMEARRLILTHVSSRYDCTIQYNPSKYKDPKLEEADTTQELEPISGPTEGAETGDKDDPPEVPFFDPSYSRYHQKAPEDMSMKVCSANDYMRVKVKDIMLLEHFEPLMAALSGQRIKGRLATPPPGSALSLDQVTPESPRPRSKTLKRERRRLRRQSESSDSSGKSESGSTKGAAA